MSRRKPPRGLRPDEVDLWRRVQDSATPLHPGPRTAPEPAPPAEAAPEERPRPVDLGGLTLGGKVPTAPPRPGPSAGQSLRMDAKAFARMRRGKLSVEGRLDLHGMTLSEAHPRLIDFVLGAHGRGKRLVLVITGKGQDRGDDWAMPSRRGILRQQVPIWLSSGPLRAAVLQTAPAHRGHGGEGALYVYLRRRR